MSAQPPTASGEAGKILIADDDRFVKKLLELILSREGFEVLTAEDGSQALEIAAAQQPSLIILDIEMPGLDGYETCRALSEDNATRGIPVIFLSSRREVSAKIAGLEIGAVDYVAKPFEPREFLARVRASLRSSRTPSQRAGAIQPGERDRRIARQLREALLADLPADPPGFELGASACPGASPTGDFYAFVERRGRTLVAYGQLRGESLPAIAAAHQLQTFFRHAELPLDQPAAVAAVTEHFFRLCCRSELTLALTLLGWSGAGGDLRLGGAGGCSPLLARPGKAPRLVPVAGQPITVGADGSAAREDARLALEPGDVLLLYPDVLAEDGVPGYDMGRLYDTLGRGAGRSAEQLARQITDELAAASDALPSDATVVVLRRPEVV